MMLDRMHLPLCARWRGLASAEKFLVYNRWSLQATVVLSALGFSTSVWPSWTSAGMWVSAALAVEELRVQPALHLEAPPRRQPAALGALVNAVLVVLAWFTPGASASSLVAVVVANTVVAFTPFFRRGLLWNAAVSGAGATLLLFGSGSFALAVLCLLAATLTPVILWTVRLMLEAHRSRALEAQLRVSEERLRFARDLHDTLGQSLAAMSIKIQLATKFAERGDARLTDELASLRRLIDTTVGDMHGVVDNYRAPDLEREVAGAVSLLRQSGIAVEVTGSPTTVHPDVRVIAGWLVREAVTNVLRHSHATRVGISLEPRRVRITNNAPHPGTGRGAGLDNLTARAAEAGGTITVDRSATSFTITLEVA